MSISAVSSAAAAYQSATHNSGKQFRKDFADLANALQAGDLSGAQNAYSALQQWQQGFQLKDSGSAAQDGSANSPLGADLGAIGKALQAGDLTSAQNAFKKFQQDAQSARHDQGWQQVGAALHGLQHSALAAKAASPAAVDAANSATGGTTGSVSTATTVSTRRSNYELRQEFYGIKPPVPTDAPDADGRTGSYRKLVTGIDPRIPGNPGYADYYGLGGTAVVADLAARNSGVNMGGVLRNPASVQVATVATTVGNSSGSTVNKTA